MREWFPVLAPIWLLALCLTAFSILAYSDQRDAFMDWLRWFLQ